MSKTVAKSLSILKQFTPAAGDLGASDVSRLLGMDKVIAYRLLRTLAAEDFLVQDASSKKYRLGPDLIELASDNLRQVPAGEVVRPWMESLRDLSDETVMLVVRCGTETLFIAAPGWTSTRAKGAGIERSPSNAGCDRLRVYSP